MDGNNGIVDYKIVLTCRYILDVFDGDVAEEDDVHEAVAALSACARVEAVDCPAPTASARTTSTVASVASVDAEGECPRSESCPSARTRAYVLGSYLVVEGVERVVAVLPVVVGTTKT